MNDTPSIVLDENGVWHCDAVIRNQRGLHARAAAHFARLAGGFDAETSVTRGGTTVSGVSVMGLLMLGASPGTTIHIATRGREAEEAINVLSELVAAKFQED